MAGEIALVLAFILGGGFFAAAEMALVSLRPAQVSRLAEQSRRGRQIERLLSSPNRFLSAVQIGLTLAGFLSSAFGAVTLAKPVETALRKAGMSSALASTVSVVAVTVAIAYVALVLGELAPKRIAFQRTEGVALAAAPVLDVLERVTRPVIWLLGKSTDLVIRLVGGDPKAGRDAVSEAELRELVASNAELTPDERTLIEEVLDAGDRPIREVMTPRLDVLALAADLTLAEAAQAVAGKPHSRYPVVDGGLDDVVGFVHMRDLLAPRPGTDPFSRLRDAARPVLRLPDSRRALPAMAEMRREGAHLAVVVDEYGGGAGIVTLEDLIEELVGDITDEFDAAEALGTPADGPGLHLRAAPGRPPALPEAGVEAQLRLEEFEEATGVALPEGPYDTAAGWLVAQLGRIPQVGDAAEHDGVRLTVAELRGRRVERVLLARVDPDGYGAVVSRPPADPAPTPSIKEASPASPGPGQGGGRPDAPAVGGGG